MDLDRFTRRQVLGTVGALAVSALLPKAARAAPAYSFAHDFAKGAQRDLNAIKDRVVMLKPGDDVITGMSVLDTAGHTPGHLSFELAGAEGMLITADVANNQIVSFEHPDWKFGYDTLPELAISNRFKLLDRAATDKMKLLGYHWEYPGVGYADRTGNAFRFVGAS